MPTYDLTCDECGERFERFLTRMLREQDRVCPRCGSSKVRPGPGGGFLLTDARPSAKGCVPRGGFT
ncbi:MAG: hypothetical protein C0418_00840 [Coriobacteriaceae bacterium]|nr:hypothetical protein [Coriobacteriaceae bacterium]